MSQDGGSLGASLGASSPRGVSDWRGGGSSGIFPESFDEPTARLEPSAREETNGEPQKVRRVYYLDWFRIVAIYLVVTYHCIQSLSWIDLWAEGDEAVYQSSVNVYKCFSLMVGMPVFYHISGRAQALARPKTMRETISKRLLRLGLPCVVAYFLLIPFWQYVEYRSSDNEKYIHIREHDDMPMNFPLWLGWFFGGHFEFNIGWLWFLPALLLIGVINAPLFIFAETKQYKYAYMKLGLLLCLISVYKALGFSIVFCFYVCLGPISAMIAVVYAPFAKLGDRRWSVGGAYANFAVTVIYICSHVGMVKNFRYADIDAFAKPLPALVLFMGFYAQGYFAQRWECDTDMERELRIKWGHRPERVSGTLEMGEGSSFRGQPGLAPNSGDAAAGGATSRSSSSTTANNRKDDAVAAPREEGSPAPRASMNLHLDLEASLPWGGLLGARIARVIVGFVTILAMAWGAPNGDYEEELFPLYSASFKPNGIKCENTFFAVAHIMATWAYIYITTAYFAAYTDYEIHPNLYEHLSKSTMVTYIFHFIFAKPFAFWVCKDFQLTSGWWLLLDPFMTFFVAVFGSWGIYALMVKFPVLGQLFGL